MWNPNRTYISNHFSSPYSLQIGANKDIDFLQTCLQQLLQIGTGVKHLLTLMLTALGRVFSSGLVWEEGIKWNEKNNFRIFYPSFVWEF